MCEWLTRSKIVGSTCATPSSFDTVALMSLTMSAMPSSEVPSGPSTVIWKSPMSSFGMNVRPRIMFRGKVSRKIPIAAANTVFGLASAQRSDRE